MKKDEHIDKLFREKFLNYEKEPPAYLLENILAGVAGARRKRKIIFWRIAGVAAALLLAFVAGWQINYTNKEKLNQNMVVNQNSLTDTKKAIIVSPETKSVLNDDHRAEVTKNMQLADLKAEIKVQELSRIRNQQKTTSDQLIESTPSKNDALLLPLKSLNRLIKNNQLFANVLHEMDANNSDSGNDEDERTIDQQIIDQNKQILLAQNEDQKKGRWLVGAQVSPAYSVNRSSHSSQYASNMLNSSSSSPVELGGGISVEYKPGKRWSLQSGIYYSGLEQTSGNTSRSNNSDYMFADPGTSYFNTPVNIEANNTMMVNSNAGVIEFNSIPAGIVVGNSIESKTMTSAVIVSDARFSQNFEYIEIPLYLRYTVLASRFDVELLGGLSSNVLVGNDTYMENSSGKTLVGKTKDMESMNYSGTLGVGLKYGLSDHIFLNVEPRVKYYLNSLNSNAEVSYKPYTIGVYTGISYQF